MLVRCHFCSIFLVRSTAIIVKSLLHSLDMALQRSEICNGLGPLGSHLMAHLFRVLVASCTLCVCTTCLCINTTAANDLHSCIVCETTIRCCLHTGPVLAYSFSRPYVVCYPSWQLLVITSALVKTVVITVIGETCLSLLHHLSGALPSVVNRSRMCVSYLLCSAQMGLGVSRGRF